MDVFSDERPAPHAEIFTQADEPHVRFDCVYGTNHGAIQSFSLPAVHGTKVYLGARAPPPPRSKYAKASESYKAVLTDSHSHGISRDAGWLEYDKHSGVKLVNLQGAGLPMFMNGILNKADEIILEPTDNLELGFGGTKKDADHGALRRRVRQHASAGGGTNDASAPVRAFGKANVTWCWPASTQTRAHDRVVATAVLRER